MVEISPDFEKVLAGLEENMKATGHLCCMDHREGVSEGEAEATCRLWHFARLTLEALQPLRKTEKASAG